MQIEKYGNRVFHASACVYCRCLTQLKLLTKQLFNKWDLYCTLEKKLEIKHCGLEATVYPLLSERQCMTTKY